MALVFHPVWAQSTEINNPDEGISAQFGKVLEVLKAQVGIFLADLQTRSASLLGLTISSFRLASTTCPVSDTATTSSCIPTPPPPPPSPPNAPSNVNAYQLGYAPPSASVIVTWQDNSNNESGFRVERSINGVTFVQIALVSSNTIFYQNSSVSPGSQYYYRVRAYNNAGYSTYSNVATVLVAPITPANFSANAVSSSQINLNWQDTSLNESGFRLQRKIGAGAIAPLAFTPPNTTAYIDAGLVSSTLYTYYLSSFVTATSTATSSLIAYSPSVVASATTTSSASSTIPTPPTNLNATASSSVLVTLTWTDNSNNELGFKVERRFGIASTTPFFQIATTTANVTVYPDGGVTASTTYSYRVRAFNVVGNSAYSNTAIVTTP